MAADLLEGAFINKGPNLDALLKAVAHLELLDLIDETPGEILSNPVVDVDAVDADAGLARSPEELGCYSPINGLFQVCILEDYIRGMAAQLKGDPLELLRNTP